MQGARGGGNASHLAQAKQRLNRSSRDVVPRHLQHTNKCVQHTFATHLTFAFAFIGPSRLPLNCFFRSRIRDVFVTILRCISVATFLLLLAARPAYGFTWPPGQSTPLESCSCLSRFPCTCTLPHPPPGKGNRIQFAISFLERSPPPTPTVIRIWIRIRTRSRSRTWLQHSSGF